MGEGELSAEQVATLFFNAVVRLFGLPDEVLHDRDPRFTADFKKGTCGMPWVLGLCLALPTILRQMGKQKRLIAP